MITVSSIQIKVTYKARYRLREAKLKRPRVTTKLVAKLQTCVIIN
jgi:hypothetical protein